MAIKNIKGLKCDKPGCGYVDPTVPRADYEKWIGRPCPKCGSSLLTQADYDTVVFLETLEDTPEARAEARLGYRTKVNLHGKGLADADVEVTKEP